MSKKLEAKFKSGDVVRVKTWLGSTDKKIYSVIGKIATIGKVYPPKEATYKILYGSDGEGSSNYMDLPETDLELIEKGN